ncbi:MAG: hypothetical protein ACOC10_10735 [Bacteroidota bacterium]
MGDVVGGMEAAKLNALKKDMGDYYEFYDFAQKVDRLNNPNFLGSGSWYGNFLGPEDAGPRELLKKMGARDLLDKGAQIHDKAYQTYEKAGGGMYIALFSKDVIGADFQLVSNFGKAIVHGGFYDPAGYHIAKIGLVAFSALGTMKTLGYASGYSW